MILFRALKTELREQSKISISPDFEETCEMLNYRTNEGLEMNLKVCASLVNQKINVLSGDITQMARYKKLIGKINKEVIFYLLLSFHQCLSLVSKQERLTYHSLFNKLPLSSLILSLFHRLMWFFACLQSNDNFKFII